jgi:hypothetical protein
MAVPSMGETGWGVGSGAPSGGVPSQRLRATPA